MNLQRYLQAQTKTTITLFAVGLTLLVSGVDFLTGPLAFSIFYLLPVSLAAWFAGRWIGNCLALLIAGAWFLFDTFFATAPHTLSVDLWNSAVRCGFFLVVVLLLTKLKALHVNLEQRVAERTQALHTSETRYRSLFDNMTEGFALHEIITDLNDQPVDSRFLEINSAFERLTGLQRADVLGRLKTECLPDDEPEWIQIYGKVALTGAPLQFEKYSAPLKRWYDVAAYRPAPRQFAVVFADITARKQSEAAAKLQFAQLASDKMWDAAYWICSDGRVEYVNDAACRQLGYTRAELLALNISDLDPDMTPARWTQAWRDNKIAKHRILEARHRAKDGRILPVELTVSHLENAGNEYHFSIARDLMARRQAEAALREEQEKLALAVAGSDGAPWDIPMDPTGPEQLSDKLTASPRLKAFIGFRAAEFPDSVAAWWDRIHPEDVPAIRASVQAHVANQTLMHRVEYRIRHKDGSWRWIASTGRLARDPQGRPVGWAGIDWDITDRKRTEAELERLVQERTQTLQNIYDSSQDVIAYADLAGRLLTFNHAFETLTGYSAAELRQMTLFQLTPPEFLDQSRRTLAELLRTGTPARYEKDYYRKDGSRVPVALTVWAVHDQTGQVTGLASIIRDVTEQHQLQQQILEVSDREHRRISQDLHDGICQLLTATTFAVGALEERLTASGVPDAYAAHEIGELIRRANTETRSVAHALHPVELDAGGLPAALQQLANTGELSGKVACTLVCPAILPALGNTRALHIYRIAQEAVANALRHGAPTHITIALTATAGAIQLQVANNGRDIPADAAKQPGMGLNIMAYRARMIGGSLQVCRGAAGGTVVELNLPEANDT